MRRRAPPLARTRSRHKAQHGARVGQVRILRACPHGDQEPSARRSHRTCRLTGSAQSAQRTPKNRTTAALKGEARLIDPCNASAHQGPAHGDGLRRPTGESSHRSSRHHGAASMPLDPPPGTDPTTQLAAQQPRFTPKRRGVPNMLGWRCIQATRSASQSRPMKIISSCTATQKSLRSSENAQSYQSLCPRDSVITASGSRLRASIMTCWVCRPTRCRRPRCCNSDSGSSRPAFEESARARRRCSWSL